MRKDICIQQVLRGTDAPNARRAIALTARCCGMLLDALRKRYQNQGVLFQTT